MAGFVQVGTDQQDGASDEDPGPSPFGVLIEYEGWAKLAGAEAAAERAYAACLTALPDLRGREVSLALSDDAAITALNAQYRGKPKATNVLSFPAAPGPAELDHPPLGDIIIAFETVMREAEDERKPPLDHLSHLTIHAILHLAGFDHETESEAERMEAMERDILASLGIPDPYLGTSEEQPVTAG